MATKQSVTKYPQTITQPYPANNKAHWKNTNNLKTAHSNPENNHASTEKITGKTGTKPGVETIQLFNFNFNIPTHAVITSIKISYAYRLDAHTSGKYPQVLHPEFMLKNNRTGTDTGYYDRNGVTPSKDWKTGTLTYKADNYILPTAKTINKSDWGFEIRFPKNSNENAGYIYLNNVSLTVTYLIPDFPVDLVMVGDDNGEFVKDVPFKIQAVVNNPDLAESIPTVELTVPSGTTLAFPPNTITSDTLVKISDTKYQLNLKAWKWIETVADIDTSGATYVNTKKRLPDTIYAVTEGSRIVDLMATVTSTGSKTFTILEKLGNKTQSRNITVVAQSTPVSDDVEIPAEQAIYAVQNTDFTLPVRISPSMVGQTIYLYTDTAIQVKSGGSYTSVTNWYTIPANSFDETGYCELICKTSNTGIINISITNDNTSVPEVATFIVKVAPAGYDEPRFTVIKLSTEECNRLGDKHTYTVQADMRITCLAANVQYFVDYYRNLRIGVVNEIPTTLDVSTIFHACRNWSNAISVFNEFEKKTVDFKYDKNYPVYIIITGNYNTTVCDLFEGEFGNLQCIESNRDDGDQVIFPVPIKNTINGNDDTGSVLTLQSGTSSNNLIFYDLGLNEAFGGKDNLAIRGVAVKVTAVSDSPSTLTAQLKSPMGVTGERSAILSEGDTHIIGGTTDRWGFNVSDLVALNNFELELNVSNITGAANTVEIEKVEIIPYYIFYEKQLVDWIVEDENMAGFNVFLQDVEVPEGLKTSTKYLAVDGTDTNDAYRMNIKEKTIKVKFSVDECNIKEATSTLQDITQKLITIRDNLYRPIPKRLEFSHYPGIYWEYIMEEPIKAEANGSSYDCEVDLVIPAGTAYNVEDTTTGKSGRVSGLAKVNPTLMIIPTSEHVEITERFSEQKFLMSYTTWTTNDVVEIDCKNRKIYLHRDEEATDISAYADWNTDWFLLYDQFMFDESGCVIQSVTWNERK